MKAREIYEYLSDQAPWVKERERTCDGFKFGDPEKEVRKVVVSWMSTMKVIKEAIKRGADFILTHEPTFFNHWDEIQDVEDLKAYKEKVKLLEENHLVVCRFHDGWDPMPEDGVLAAFARNLGFSEIAAEKDWRKVYKIEPASVKDLALHVAKKLNLDAVRVLGDLDRKVSRVGLAPGAGTGEITRGKLYALMEAELVICGETREWQFMRFLEDSGISLIVTSHAVSERWGIENLAKRVEKQFPQIEVEYIDAGCPWVTVVNS